MHYFIIILAPTNRICRIVFIVIGISFCFVLYLLFFWHYVFFFGLVFISENYVYYYDFWYSAMDINKVSRKAMIVVGPVMDETEWGLLSLKIQNNWFWLHFSFIILFYSVKGTLLVLLLDLFMSIVKMVASRPMHSNEMHSTNNATNADWLGYYHFWITQFMAWNLVLYSCLFFSAGKNGFL